MDISPYLSAVQSLTGQEPGEKYKDLHLIAAQLMDNSLEGEEFVKTGVTSRVQPGLLPYLRAIVGCKFRIGKFVIEGLMSDDVTIVKQALSARWFFSDSSPLVEVKYFVEEVVPHVSMRTRLELMKTLAHCLVEDPRKAEHFFDNFADLYGVEQSLPLIVACGEDFIFQTILRRRIVLPGRILVALYRRYPPMVVRYLQLGNTNNSKDEVERKLHRIEINRYIGFMPQLVKYHTHVFIELYECLQPHEQILKLGSTRADYFLKNAMDTLIQRPRTYLNMLPLKLVSNKLSTQQFDLMFQNLLKKDRRDFRISDVIKYLQYYPQEKKFDLLVNAYKYCYQADLLNDAEMIFSTKEFYTLLPSEVKEQRARNFIKSFEGKSEYHEFVRFLPPNESVPILKEKISKVTDLESRSRYIEHMIISCSLYDSKGDLLKVLEYYNTRHKNEQAVVLQQVLGALVQRFDIAKLDRAHWQILKDIIQRSYIRGDLNDAPSFAYVPLFSGALRYYIKRCQEAPEDKEDAMFLDRLVSNIIELFLERNIKWDFVIETPDVGRDCLSKFLEKIENMYPETSPVWNNSDNKMSLVTYLIRAMQGVNEKGEMRKRKHKRTSATTSDSKDGRPQPTKFTIRNYAWLKNLAYGLLKSRNQNNSGRHRLSLRRFAKMLRQHDAELYQSLIDEDDDLTNDVESEDALQLLKRDHDKILAKWKRYVEVCRESVKFSRRSTQRFIISTKWHHEIPIRFVEHCAAKLEVKGNALILGLLLEGEALAKLITPYLPKEAHMDIQSADAKNIYEITASLPKAMNLANPPLSFDVLLLFCQGDYMMLALQSLSNASQRIPVDKVLAFVNRDLISKPITVKKQAIRIVFQVAARSESRDFLRRLWSEERNQSIREMLAKMILKLFKKSPSQDSWSLLKVCIEGLTSEDRNVFTSLECVHEIDRSYVASYIEEFLKKMDSFTEAQFDYDSRLSYFKNISGYIGSELLRHLPEDLVINIIERYPLNYATTFTIGIFLLSDSDKFEARLKSFIEILVQELQHFDEPDKEVPRCCTKNREVREFFVEIVHYVNRVNDAKVAPFLLRLVNELLLLFTSPLRPWKEPHGYMGLCICKDYLEVSSPKEFGERCALTAEHLIDVFASELVLIEFADRLLRDVLQCDNVFKMFQKKDIKLTVIEGMISKEPRIGALVGIKLLCHYEVPIYDGRFDKFMKTWKAMDNPTVQAVLSEFVNTNNRLYRGPDTVTPMRLLSLH